MKEFEWLRDRIFLTTKNLLALSFICCVLFSCHTSVTYSHQIWITMYFNGFANIWELFFFPRMYFTWPYHVIPRNQKRWNCFCSYCNGCQVMAMWSIYQQETSSSSIRTYAGTNLLLRYWQNSML